MGAWDVPYLQRVEAIGLRSWEVDDRVVEHLCRLTTLEYLDLRGTSVSRKGVERIRQSLPGISIREPSDRDRRVGAIERQLAVIRDELLQDLEKQSH